jgi:hypothetical protein
VAIRQGQPLTAERIKQLNAETKLYTNGKYQTYDSIPKIESTLNLRGRIAQRATSKAKGTFKGTGVGNPGTFRPGPANDLREYLKTLPNGSKIERIKLANRFGVNASMVTKVLKEFKDKNFKFINPVKGIKKGPLFQLTKAQKELPMLLFGKTENELTTTQRSNIVNGKVNKNTMTPYRIRQTFNPFALKEYGKDWNNLTESEKERVRAGKPPADPNRIPVNKAKVQSDLLKLSKDSRIIDIFQNPERTKSQLKKDVKVVKSILGKTTNALARLTQLAAAFAGDTPVPGITTKFKANAEKIYNELPHNKIMRDIDELKIGKSVGEKSIKTIKQKIRKNPNYIFSGDYNIDEVAGVTSSIKRGTTPYGIFGQVIDRDINVKDKMSFDGNKSKKELALQEAIKTDNPKLINKALQDFNNLVSNYENKINAGKPANTPRVKLFRATLDSPVNSIANFNTFNPEYKKAFLNNFDTRGYSFQVPKDIKTIPQILEATQDPNVIKKMSQLAGRFAPRLLSVLPLAAGYVGLSKLFGGTAVEAAEVSQPQVKQLQVGEPLKYDATQGSIVNANTDQTADQNQILEYVKDNPLKVTAGTSLGFAAQEVPGAYKAARDLGRGRVRSTLGISGALRPLLTTFGTPLMTGLYEGAIGSKRLDEGETMTEVLTDPLGPALGVSLMEPLSKLSGVVKDAPKRTMLEGAKNYFNLSNVGKARPGITGQVLRMGMSPKMIAGASRFLGLPGLALGLGMSGYDAYKNYQNQEGMIYNLFNRDE